MPNWLRIYYKSFNLLLNRFIKSKSIPTNPIVKLQVDTSCPIMYVLFYNSKVDLLTLRMQCLKKDLPDPLDPLIVKGKEFPRFIFIDKKSKIFSYCMLQEKTTKLFHSYLSLQQNNPDVDIQIIPISVMFRHQSNYEKENTNLLLYIFNFVKNFFSIVWIFHDIFVIFSPFVSLRWIIKKYNSDKNIIYKLIRIAHIHFIRQRLASSSCIQKKQNLFSKLLTSKAIIRAIEDEAQNRKISIKEARKNAISLIEEISANFSYKVVYLTDCILRFTWDYLYQKINVHNIERVQKLAYDGHKIVYIPCHRSHMDYILLSYVIYHQGLMPPHIAAGINLNFWPTGPIFRRLGAFFIRRTFKANKLYSTIFREYLGELFNYNYSIEYFIEGGRSRTGRLLNPKTGTLSMTVQAMLQGKKRPITLVPIYIGYENIIEIHTYTRELRGAKKEKENLLNILRGLMNLHNLGQSYINFGEPLSLIHWLNKHVPSWHKSIDRIESVRPSWLAPIVNDIADNLMIRINNAGATNAMNLCCTALLASYQCSLTLKQLTEQIDCYLDLMRNVPYSEDATIPSLSSSNLIEHALKMNKFKVEKDTIDDIIILSREQAVLLTYYRNNIAHMLILPSLMATIISQCHYVSRKKLLYYVSILYPMLKAELFLHWDYTNLIIELDRFTKEFLRQNLVILKDNKLQINPLRFRTFQLLAAGAREMLQRYAITFWLLIMNPSINRAKLENDSQNIAHRLSMIYGINAPEFFDKKIFSKLILTLHEEGYINNSNNIQLKKITKVYQILTELISLDVRLTIENSCIKKINP